MNITTKLPMTIEQFLAWDDLQEGRHEFDGSDAIEMMGCASNHEFIVAKLMMLLGMRLLDTRFEVYSSSLRLRGLRSVRLPDVQVFDHILDGRATIADDPVAVFEVLSPSTQQTDRFAKADEYWLAPTIAHYVMVEQAFMGAVTLTRGPSSWIRTTTIGPDGAIDLPAIGTEIPLADLYRGLTLPPAG